jgi:hypothetical protein
MQRQCPQWWLPALTTGLAAILAIGGVPAAGDAECDDPAGREASQEVVAEAIKAIDPKAKVVEVKPEMQLDDGDDDGGLDIEVD